MEHAYQYEICDIYFLKLVKKLPDQKRVLRFFLDQVREIKLEEVDNMTIIPFNDVFWAIEELGDPEAITLLKEKIEEMLDYQGLYKKEGSVTKGFNPVAYQFVSALAALYKLEFRKDYIRLLEGFELHPNVDVASLAERSNKKVKSFMDGKNEE